MNDIEINDIRNASDFKSISFSKYKTAAVIKELLNSMVNCKIENACNWSAELICAGHYSELWNAILIFIGKHIHLGNPKLPIYVENRFNKFKEILMNGYLDNELSMRNNEKIRKLFSEIICVLCFSKKKHSIDPIKIKSEDEFDMFNMTSKLKATSIDFAQESFLKEDPKELFIAINELAYNISTKSKDTITACKWIEWIMEFERLCKKRKEKCICERRTFAPVQEKFQMDIVWLIWDVLLKETIKRKNELCKRIILSTLNIFCIKYTPAVKKRRRFLMYFVIGLLTEEVNYNIDIITNKQEIDTIVSKINIIYKQIKTNEEKPDTDYLFNGISKSNLEKTIEKLDKMKEINTIIPQK
jgi:hypothetical protein